MRPMSSRRQHPHFLLLGLPPFLLPILGLNPFAFLHVSLRDCRVPDVETFLAAVAEAVFVASGCRTKVGGGSSSREGEQRIREGGVSASVDWEKACARNEHNAMSCADRAVPLANT